MILWKNTLQKGDPNFIADVLDIHRFSNRKVDNDHVFLPLLAFS